MGVHAASQVGTIVNDQPDWTFPQDRLHLTKLLVAALIGQPRTTILKVVHALVDQIGKLSQKRLFRWAKKIEVHRDDNG